MKKITIIALLSIMLLQQTHAKDDDLQTRVNRVISRISFGLVRNNSVNNPSPAEFVEGSLVYIFVNTYLEEAIQQGKPTQEAIAIAYKALEDIITAHPRLKQEFDARVTALTAEQDHGNNIVSAMNHDVAKREAFKEMMRRYYDIPVIQLI